MTRKTFSALCLSLCLLAGCARKAGDRRGSESRPDGRHTFALRMLAADAVGGGDAAISPDGRRFVTSSRRSGNWDLWVYDIEAGSWSQLTTDPADDFEAQWSPDGTRLVFTSTRGGGKDLWLLSLADRQERLLFASPEDDEYPAWSPDGKTIVYTTGPWMERDFYLIAAEGGEPRRLSRQSGRAGACGFAPDGQSVVCHTYDEGSGDIIGTSLDGARLRTFTDGGAWDYKPRVSPDGKWLAFSRGDEGPSSIWVMPAEPGAAPRQLASTQSDDRWPSWSSSGERLFFHRLSDRGVSLKVFDRRTREVRTLTREGERPRQADFDPTARRVAFGVEEGGRLRIRVLDLDEGTARTLPTGAGDADFPRWSPDGGRLAFASRVGRRWEICTVNSDGTDLKVWTQGLGNLKGLRGLVDWSPDGSQLVFKGDTDPFESDLYVLDTAGGKVRNVTNDHWFDESPSWTPDGKGILFMSTRGGNWTWGLFRYSVEDGAVSVVSAPDYTEKNYPRMGRGGHVVWSTVSRSGEHLLAEKSPGGRVEILSPAGTDTRWPSYSADGRYILFTTVEQRVEFWLAEHPFAAGSPLLGGGPAVATDDEPKTHDVRARETEAVTCTVATRVSPVDLHRR